MFNYITYDILMQVLTGNYTNYMPQHACWSFAQMTST